MANIKQNRSFLIVIFFVLLNSVKIDFIDHFIIFPHFHIPISYLSLKLLFYVVLNSLIFFSVFRFKNIIPFLLVYGLQALYLFVHLSYALYFDAPFHMRQFIADIYEGVMLARHFSVPMNLKYLAVAADLPLLVLIILNYPKITQFLKSKKVIINYLLIALFAFLIYSTPLFYKGYRIIDGVNDTYKSEIWVIDKLGLIGNDFLDLIVFQDEKSLIAKFKYGDKTSIKDKKINQPYNIICIQVETLDSNIIDYSYKDQYICPFLHQLSSNCVYYPSMLFYHFAGGSGDTDFTVINSTLPLVNFPSYKIRNYSYPNSLVKQLIKANVNSMIFHNNAGNFFNRKVAFFKMGFHGFYDIDDMHLNEKGWGAPDHEMFGFIEKKLKRQKIPFFYYIITMSSHEPFMAVSRYYRNNSYSDIKDRELRGYFDSFSYVDRVLDNFVAFVKNNIKDTYIFIYGDHNAYILRDHPGIPFKNLGVPLFIITPDGKIYRETKKIASMLDLSQTILSASGINFEIMTQGANLLDFPIKNGPIPVNAGSSYDRETLFGKDMTSFSNIDKQKI